MNFRSQIPRKIEQYATMSESCFSHEKVDVIRRRAQGTLQFGKSTELKLAAQKAPAHKSFSVDKTY